MTTARAERHLAEPIASGSTLRPEFRPYRYRQNTSPYRASLTAAILAQVGDEEDAWDSAPPLVSRRVGGQYVKPCGTEAAYRRHRRHGEEPCGVCFDAHNAYKKPKGSTRKRPVDIAERLHLLATLRVHTGNGRGLRPGEVTTAQAAEKLGVDVRTIGRYLQRLRGAA